MEISKNIKVTLEASSEKITIQQNVTSLKTFLHFSHCLLR